MIDRTDRIWIAGHRGLVGAALVRVLQAAGFSRLILRGRDELDLLDAAAVEAFYAAERPDVVIWAAARVGGIAANADAPYAFLHENLRMQVLGIDAALRHGVRRFLFLGSSCIYPRDAPQPIPESALLTGPLEASNQWYAIAKIAGIHQIQAARIEHGFGGISAMPTNLYGPGDNFDPETSHVLPALIRRFEEARLADAPEVLVWGSGRPLREFMHVDDCAEACLHLLQHYDEAEPINLGSGQEISIRELAGQIAEIVGYRGGIRFDPRRPDGTPRKRLDTRRLEALGWRARIPLDEGIRATLVWYRTLQAGPDKTSI